MGIDSQSRKVKIFEKSLTLIMVAIVITAAMSEYGFRVAISGSVAISGIFVFSYSMASFYSVVADKDKRAILSEWRKLLLPVILSITNTMLIFLLRINGEFPTILKMSFVFTVIFIIIHIGWLKKNIK
jgi:hypothetical protein